MMLLVLSIATKTKSQVEGLSVAKRNVSEALFEMETAKNALNATTSNLQRIRELFIQGINGTNSQEEKDMLQLRNKFISLFRWRLLK